MDSEPDQMLDVLRGALGPVSRDVEGGGIPPGRGDRFPRAARVVSIGPITSEAARDAGLEVAVEAERFREWQASLAVVPAIASLHARAEEIRAGELAKAEGRLGRLPESERKLVESMTSQIVAKILHLPTVRMKEAAAGADGVVYADVVRHLFGLGEEEQS